MLDKVRQAPCRFPSTLGFSPGTLLKVALAGVCYGRDLFAGFRKASFRLGSTTGMGRMVAKSHGLAQSVQEVI